MNLSQEEWAAQLEADSNYVVLDVRTDDEFQDGYIPDAIQIDIHQGQGFVYRLEELDKTKNYYVYCRSGARSAKACSIMNELGFENTFNLEGGIMNWEGDIIVP
ncbi:rhodanese-like domain-containing protein [Flavobacterium branchiophilum]|uniref:Rhodanese-related sulfurtransferase n=1 Tax=Flavobacterium branchiophilum (strain FL-15) TaxID=1034807 RepID=G2Z5U5_FLABF|nr:rhodanese-like domain-containing protein [Flavobacterium branchiophilum]CCB68705.1 Rhodanese-related sulfurtransferase [Flavobacterium branchiophilum FL-15]